MQINEVLSKIRSLEDQIVDEAFKQLYREYYPMIRKLIISNSGSESDAADVFQDTLIVFYAKVRSSNFELTCSVKTFIYSVSRNLWLKKLEAYKRDKMKKDALLTIPISAQTTDILVETEQTKLISRLLKKIGADGERLLTYFYFEGLKTDEVTLKMGYASEQVTRNKKSKCLKKLRTLIQEHPILKEQLL